MNVQIDDVFPITAQASQFSTGAAYDATGSPAYRVYEQITDTPILTGSLALVDDSNTVGFYGALITLSAANGFEVGKFYTVRVSATVDSVDAAEIVARFRVDAVPLTAAGVLDTADYGDTAGRATTIGGQIAQIWRYLFNKNTINRQTGLHTLYRDDESATLVSGTNSEDGVTTTVGEKS